MMVGDFDYEGMRQVDSTWTPVFFSMYIGFMVLVMVNVFLAILNESYNSVREELTEQVRGAAGLCVCVYVCVCVRVAWRGAAVCVCVFACACVRRVPVCAMTTHLTLLPTTGDAPQEADGLQPPSSDHLGLHPRLPRQGVQSEEDRTGRRRVPGVFACVGVSLSLSVSCVRVSVGVCVRVRSRVCVVVTLALTPGPPMT